MKNHILVLTELFLPTKGGTAVWFDEVYRKIGGKEIHIITDKVKGSTNHDAIHPNSIHRLNLVRIAWLRPESLAMYIKFLLYSFKLFCLYNFKIIHTGRVLPEGLVGLILCKIFRVPLIVYAHGEEITTWSQPIKAKTMKFVYRQADCIIANSEFTINELIKLDIPRSKIYKISPGVNIDLFKPGLKNYDFKPSLGLKNSDLLILSVGRLTRRKGFDQTIKAVSKLKNMGLDINYAIVGTGEDFDYLNNIAKDFGILNNVHFLGHISNEDLPMWYNAADVFVMPNREINGDTEGFGMVFIEANACKKPVISGLSGGTGAAVIHGYTGYRVDGTSIDELSKFLYKLLTDKELSDQLGDNGYNRVLSEFSWQSVAEKTIKITKSLL